MRSRALPIAFAVILSILIVIGIIYSQKNKSAAENQEASIQPVLTQPGAVPSVIPSATLGGSPIVSQSPVANASPGAIDLTPDASGLSKATVVMTTTKGVIKFKFYTKDAPNTVNRMVELISKGFYNGLTFHRVVPGFVVQGGDPQGNGTGGSGTKLKAEFNDRHHQEGSVAMARSQDPDSADSQFYICLAPQPSLDHHYTVFGQVIDGMDVVRNIQVGDKMTSVTVQ
jgi:cyclophilin family peptidyl-prolyl cis-trans isomerase